MDLKAFQPLHGCPRYNEFLLPDDESPVHPSWNMFGVYIKSPAWGSFGTKSQRVSSYSRASPVSDSM